MTSAALRIRALGPGEIGLAIEWAAVEGWNPGLHDAACFHAADPGGFLVGSLGDEPIATISVVKYGATFGFLGLYIVKKGFRGRGYGMQIWEAGLARLAGRNVGLDGVVAQQDNYRKSGFRFTYRNIRYRGTANTNAPIDARIVPLSSVPVADVIAYDRAFFPDDRSDFLRCWIAQPDSTALGILRGSTLAGYGVVRRSRDGYKIGPLFADDSAFAESLFGALQAYVPHGASLYLDAPEANAAAMALAERHGMTVVFETARMYTGAAPQLPLRRLFGVTTFELG
jgi:GNAT acetyltransferase-like protein/acetyltransferase (GNAT) family protein